ncbi:MAG: hypothetical protein A2447_01840 [Omnitrophica WOR_2 bacterium RIFOXYC2_FULL_38_12]|nr:MAG: hypothetical protein A2447_01840 [Omnitrophica WOR_2 bacterium RIFOXYC2_FULL_38_12]
MDSLSKNKVKAANKKLYNAIASKYDEIDGRRSLELRSWIKETLAQLKAKGGGDKLLDLGTGSGLITSCAENIFSTRIGVDISSEILKLNRSKSCSSVVSDVDKLPFKSNSFDVITCFAVLHHLYNFEDLVKEISRVLKPGGVFYSDHDMEALFYKRFWPILKLYRIFHDASKRYQESSDKISKEMYDLTEVHENGINSTELTSLFNNNGFNIIIKYHWYGLSNITDKLFAKKCFLSGFAPLMTITAVKEH